MMLKCAVKSQKGKGNWTSNYNGDQSCITTLTYYLVLATFYWLFPNFTTNNFHL